MARITDPELLRRYVEGEMTPTEVQARLIGRALRGQVSKRDMAMFGYSDETRRTIVRAIELDPALEEAILLIAELAYGDGADSATECSGYPEPPE